MFIFPKGQHRF